MMRIAKQQRIPVSGQEQQRHKTRVFPAPIRGWVANESLALSKPGAAYLLENIFPTLTGARLRGGSLKHATVGIALVESLLTYRSGSLEKLFAASDGEIFDITAPADSGIPPTADVTGQTSNYYSHVQFATVGGEYMIAVNGTDLHHVYDGAAWAQDTPAITGTTSDEFSQVWSYRNRLFFVKKGTKTACYLPVDSIGGATADFTLDGIFKRGGSLLFGATWSLDAGDGLDDKCVFISTNGEAAIYQGSDPSDPADWALVGRYDVSNPMGMNATMQAGGDLLVACVDGFIPLSEAIRKDPAALSLAAISRPIEPEWKNDVFSRSTRPWEVVKWVEKNMAIVSAPAASTAAPIESRWGEGYWRTFIWGGGDGNTLTQDPYCYVVNLQSGAWTKYTGWDVQCLAYHNGYVYFGTVDGKIMQAETGGNDDGIAYVCRSCGLFEMLGNASVKILHQARATWTYGQPFIDKVSFSTNYTVNWPSSPSSAPDSGDADVWDLGVWDDALWDATARQNIRAKWISVGRTGYAVAPMVQVTCGGTVAPDAELVSIDLTYEGGAVVV